MKKAILTLIIIGILNQLIVAQNQLQSIVSSARPSPTANLVTQDSLFNFYNTNNSSQVIQLNKIWTNSELILEPNYNLNPVLQTTSDSSVRMSNNGSFTAPLQLMWATANWYNSNYTELVKQNVYGYLSGSLSSFHTTYFYYSPNIDSAIFYSGTSPSSALTLSLRRFTYKNNIGNYYNTITLNTQVIKWNYSYNTHGNLIEWKYQNPAYAISNKLYKLFYTGSSNLVDSVQYYNGGLYYQSTYTYTYGANNEWSTVAYKPDYNSSSYPNGVASYKNSYWGTQVYCDSIDNFYYFPNTQLNSYRTINNYTSTGFIESENNMYQGPTTGISSKTKYNYNLVTGTTNLSSVNKANIRVYPNPVSDVLNIELDLLGGNSATIEITNAVGRVVLSETLTTKSSTLNINHLNNGVYFAKLQLGDKTITQNLFVDK